MHDIYYFSTESHLPLDLIYGVSIALMSFPQMTANIITLHIVYIPP